MPIQNAKELKAELAKMNHEIHAQEASLGTPELSHEDIMAMSQDGDIGRKSALAELGYTLDRELRNVLPEITPR